MNVEAALVERVGPVAGKLHTGRSRNDQVATDLRLWLRRAIDRLDAAHLDMERALVDLAERDGDRDPAGDDAHPAGAARAVRPPPARLRRDARARPLAPRGHAPSRKCQSARGGRARRRGLPARSRGRRSGSRVRWRHRELARRGQRPRFRRGGAGRGGPRDGPPEPARGGDHVVVEPAVRVRSGRRRVLDRQLDDAEQAEPGSGGARPRHDRPA